VVTRASENIIGCTVAARDKPLRAAPRMQAAVRLENFLFIGPPLALTIALTKKDRVKNI